MIHDLEVSSNYLYWIEEEIIDGTGTGNRMIRRADLDGANVVDLVTTGSPLSLAVFTPVPEPTTVSSVLICMLSVLLVRRQCSGD
ncbi:MAG: hypothetical protein KDA99_15300 [Planctomycetales bacterium]|nr:hypothetical protein [Planctomycetales bacterium]